MNLTAGTTLGPYVIVAPLGAGGMGEVYRARDTRLKRDVAIKILPAEFASDPERLARFQREAEVIASLNHPNIAQIYGIEHSDSTRALVLELVEGETLAERIARSLIQIDDAVAFALQIVDALEAAHDKGIVHRDLKPANIKVTPDGTVKVLDFGLAKLADRASGSGLQAPGQSHAQLSQSPTTTSPALVTGGGVLLGTAAYMSPEQAKGKPVGSRADIWAFGCVLFEMLTRRPAFLGEDVVETLANVINREPDYSKLSAATPPSLKRLLVRCLDKDQRRRLAHIADARFDLEDGNPAAATAASGTRQSLGLYALVATLIFVAAAAGWISATQRPVSTGSVAPNRLILASGSAGGFVVRGTDRDLAALPDGSGVVYIGGTGAQLMIRRLGNLDPTPVANATPPRGLFVSQDSQWIGFWEGTTTLKRVPVAGGPPSVLMQNVTQGPPRGAAWREDGSILFATSDPETGLWVLPANGGQPAVLTKPDQNRGELDHWWPQIIPGTDAVLFTIVQRGGGVEDYSVALLNVATGEWRTLVTGGSDAHYVSSGHLIYVAGDSLRAIFFDKQTLTTTGASISVVPQVVTGLFGSGDFDVMRDGTIVYASGMVQRDRSLVWIDRTGQEQPIDLPKRRYGNVALSPDGTRAAVEIGDSPNDDIWIVDLVKQTLSRLTFEQGNQRYPVWAPDGARVFFTSNPVNSAAGLYSQLANGSGRPELIVSAPVARFPSSVSPDGHYLLFREEGKTVDIKMVSLLDRQVKPLVLAEDKYLPANGEVSPDGRWLAFHSAQSGRNEIYVRPFPEVSSGLWQVSRDGGTRPVWSRSGNELFYVQPDLALMSVPIVRGTSFSFGNPSRAIPGPFLAGIAAGNNSGGRDYDIAPDGRRFLAIKGDSTPGDLVIVQNFAEELKQKVPAR